MFSRSVSVSEEKRRREKKRSTMVYATLVDRVATHTGIEEDEKMLNQAEINFYIGNKQNILKRDTHGKIHCIMKYDTKNKLYIIERKTPRTTWTERTDNYDKAYNIYYNFLYNSMETLESRIRCGKSLYNIIYKNLWGEVLP